MVYVVMLIFNFNYGYVMDKLNANSAKIQKNVSAIVDGSIDAKTGKIKSRNLSTDADHVAYMVNVYNGLINGNQSHWAKTGKYQKNHHFGHAILSACIEFGYVRFGSIVNFYTIVDKTASSKLSNLAVWRTNFVQQCKTEISASKSPKMLIFDASKCPKS